MGVSIVCDQTTRVKHYSRIPRIPIRSASRTSAVASVVVAGRRRSGASNPTWTKPPSTGVRHRPRSQNPVGPSLTPCGARCAVGGIRTWAERSGRRASTLHPTPIGAACLTDCKTAVGEPCDAPRVWIGRARATSSPPPQRGPRSRPRLGTRRYVQSHRVGEQLGREVPALVEPAVDFELRLSGRSAARDVSHSLGHARRV
jgi:hypothetical protein